MTFQDFESGVARHKCGYRKIEAICQIARRHHHEWVWLDTCCINKANSTELNEAINSMYKWYQNSAFCAAYLFDYNFGAGILSKSTWFKRCWTLQEMISPREVRFYDKRWRFFGTKKGLSEEIAEITRVDVDTLSGDDPRRCLIAQRMCWAAGREATRVEDQAYSLLGLFDLSLPMLYGEGERAFMSLQEKILQYTTNDQSIFVWDRGLEEDDSTYHGLLANTPSAFAGCRYTQSTPSMSKGHGFSYTGVRLDFTMPTLPYAMRTYLCALDCMSAPPYRNERDCIILEQSEDDDQYARVQKGYAAIVSIKISAIEGNPARRDRKMFVRQIPRYTPEGIVHGFLIGDLELPDCTSREHEKTRLCSRDIGLLQPGSDPKILAIPDSSWGIAGDISLPQPNAFVSENQLRWIKLGFDPDFLPHCLLGSNGSLKGNYDPGMTTIDPRASRESQWDNEWIIISSDKELVYHKLKRGTYRMSARHGQNHCSETFRKLNLEVKMQLEDCPLSMDVSTLPKCGSGPWKIWTSNMKKQGDFGMDFRREQRRRALIRKQKQKDPRDISSLEMLLGVGVISALGMTAYVSRSKAIEEKAKGKVQHQTFANSSKQPAPTVNKHSVGKICSPLRRDYPQTEEDGPTHSKLPGEWGPKPT